MTSKNSHHLSKLIAVISDLQWVCVALLCLAFVAPIAQGGQQIASDAAGRGISAEKATPVSLPRFAHPPKIDGRLDDDVWKAAAIFKDFRQVQPSDAAPASKPTIVYMGRDADRLYIAFHAFDDPRQVRATIAKRDAIFDDDIVGVYLDTFNDRRRAYVLLFNPLGVQADGIFTEGRGEDLSVDIVMESKGTLTDDGYVVEVAVPFKSLRYEAGRGKMWGIHLFRKIKRFNDEIDSWMPIPRGASSLLNLAGHITELEGIASERNLELIPGTTISETGRRTHALPGASDPGRFVNGPLKVEPELNAKLGFASNITVDLALNPDFAQVEADQPVITANQRFPIFFEEKRPFFLEGIDIFQTPLQAVNTRAIVDPDVAVKLTGKRGRNVFGVLAAADSAPGNYSEEERNDPTLLPQIRKFIGKRAVVGVARLRRDIGRESSLGVVVTTYNFVERHNHVGGFDGRFRLGKQTTFDFQLLGTTSRRLFFDPDQGRSFLRTGNGFGYYFELDRPDRHWNWNYSGEGRTRDYRADVGFTRRTDTNRHRFFVRYDSEPRPRALLVSWYARQFTSLQFDWRGRLQKWSSDPQVRFNLRRQTVVGGGISFGYERLFEEEFGPKRAPGRPGAFAGDRSERSANYHAVYGFWGTTPSKRYSFSGDIGYSVGEFDYDFGAGPRFPRVSPAALRSPNAPLDPGPGRSLRMESSFAYQPTTALRASLNYEKSRLVREDTGRTAFDDNIFSLRVTYQFTRFSFLRLRIDHTTLNARVRTQFLFGWTPRPGTALYVGYNDDARRNGFNPFTGQFEPGFRRDGRTFFIKISRLIRRSF